MKTKWIAILLIITLMLGGCAQSLHKIEGDGYELSVPSYMIYTAGDNHELIHSDGIEIYIFQGSWHNDEYELCVLGGETARYEETIDIEIRKSYAFINHELKIVIYYHPKHEDVVNNILDTFWVTQ